MAVEMKKYRLADIAEIVISSVDKKTKPGEKIVRLCNFTDVYHNWAIKQSDYDSFMVASASDSNINKLSLKKGFVAFTKDSETRDDIGISTYIADDFEDVVLGYHCALAKPNEDIVYGKYLNAFMSSDYIKKYFELNATGSGMRFTLAVSTMEDMPIMLPSMKVQKKVGDMLSDFDRRIENLRAQNRVLEQTAKAIYDYTFLQCAGHQVVFNKPLNRNIPENWEVKKLSEIAKTYSGGTPKSTELKYYENGSIPWINSGELNKPLIIKAEHFITKEGLSNSSAKFYPENTVLIAMYGATVGKTSLLAFPATSNQAICGVISNDEIFCYYMYFLISSLGAHYIMLSTGSARDNISQDVIKNTMVPVPDTVTIKKFNNIVSPLFQKQLVNTKQIESLTTQRNTLLPLLMTGQIEV